MVIIDCDPLSIPIFLPECAGEGPFTATLTRHLEDLVTLTATFDAETSLLTLTGIPADTRRGVWWLNVTTSCGCFEGKVFIDMCRTPRFPSTHTPTPDGGTGEVTVCCDPVNTVGHFTVPPGEAPEITEVDGEITSVTLEDLTLTVVFNSSRTGVVTIVNSYGDVVASQAIEGSATAIFTLEETLPCGTYAVGFTAGGGGPA